MQDARSIHWMQHQPGGAYGYLDIVRHPADVFFVGSTVTGATDSVGYGQDPDRPFATLDYAVGQCTNSVGDVIYCLPGHAEVVATAGALDLDKIGITIIGIGEGALQPTITLTDAAADVDVDAASITVKNMHFVAGAEDVVAAIDVNCDDFTLLNCRFTGDNAGANALIWVQDALAAGSDRITIKDCYCMDRDASNTHFVNFSGTGTGHIITGNTLLGDFGTVCIGGAGEVVGVLITDNYISSVATTADSGVGLAAAATGIVMNNRIGIALAANATTGVDADACAMCENYVVDTGADRQGVLDPVATT